MGITTLLSASLSHAQCTKDVDCKGERICQEGQCTEPPLAAEAPASAPEVTTAAPEAGATVAPADPAQTAAAPPATLAREPEPLPDDLQSSPPAPTYKRRSRGLFAGGIVMVSLGTLALAVALVNGGLDGCDDDESAGFTQRRCQRSPNYTAFAISGLLLGGGVPMIIIGGKRVPAGPQAGLSPWISRQGGGLQLQLTL